MSGFRPAPTVGISDIIAILPERNRKLKKRKGVFVAIEVKSPTGKISEEQQQFINSVNANGGIGAVVRNINDLEKLFEPNPRRR